MTDNKPAAGWLIQAAVPGPAVKADDVVGAAKSPPAFRFFNVAIESRQEAEQAIKRKMNASEDAPIRAVRALSEDEIDNLRLKPGGVKPA
jgi:hypothetical protein